MAEIASGSVTALYLFDVADAIDVNALNVRLGDRAMRARLADKSAGPPRVQYAEPPVVIDGAAVDVAEVADFKARFKFYDYGVVSLMLTRPFAGSWAELVALGQTLIESEPLEQAATSACRRVLDSLALAPVARRRGMLSEDYLVFAVTALPVPMTADVLLDAHGTDIAQLLRGERQRLSAQERDEVLRSRISYLEDDLVVAAWNAAFIYDREPGVLAAIEVLEVANSQLLELRYHDELLESELTQSYAALQQPRWTDRLAGRRHTRAAQHLHTLFIDVNDLTDRMENAVKFVGDIYAARLFNIVAGRLGLDRWKRNVEEKLKTLDDIYRFAVEQTGMSQGTLLELAIVLILVLELALFFAGIME